MCEEWRFGYVQVLAEALGHGYDVHDCGVAGRLAVKPDHAYNMENGKRHALSSYWSEAAFNQSQQLRPDIVVSAVQRSAAQRSAAQRSAVQCSAVQQQCSAVECSAVQCSAV